MRAGATSTLASQHGAPREGLRSDSPDAHEAHGDLHSLRSRAVQIVRLHRPPGDPASAESAVCPCDPDDVDATRLHLLAEQIMWDYEPDFTPVGMEVVERDDVLMWRRPHGPLAQQRWGNRVSHVRTTPDRVENVIREVVSFFQGLTFTWVVGPSSTPADLPQRLLSRGLRDFGDGDLLTADLPIEGLRENADLEIVEVTDEATARIGLTLAHPNGAPEELEAMVRERLDYLRRPTRRGGYLVAFLAGIPVANAGYRYSGDGSAVYLTGAGTVETYRGRGVYQSIVAHRTRAAADRGCRFAVIRARRDTSLPILLKRGFIDHGHLPMFTNAENLP